VAAAVIVVVVKMFFGGSRTQQHPKTLLEPTVKYPLKLVDKVVSRATTSNPLKCSGIR